MRTMVVAGGEKRRTRRCRVFRGGEGEAGRRTASIFVDG